jgi:hypothetical protein
MADRGHDSERLSACDFGHPSSGVIEARRRIDIAVTVDVSRKFVSRAVVRWASPVSEKKGWMDVSFPRCSS